MLHAHACVYRERGAQMAGENCRGRGWLGRWAGCCNYFTRSPLVIFIRIHSNLLSLCLSLAGSSVATFPFLKVRARFLSGWLFRQVAQLIAPSACRWQLQFTREVSNQQCQGRATESVGRSSLLPTPPFPNELPYR